MKISTLISDKIANEKKYKDPEDMDLLMRTIKTVHSAATNPNAVSTEELLKQRSEVERFSRLITPVAGINIEQFNVDDILCEWVKPGFPHRVDTMILYCHGGGYISGGLGYARILATKLAQHTGLEAVSFEYRLAPENQYPAAIEDGMKVWNRILHIGYGAKNIILAGDSAGGNMALELCLRMRAEKRILPKALILMSPWTDMCAKSNSYNTYKDKDPLLTYEYIVSARSAYAGTESDFSQECFSPVNADYNGFPPTLIQVGSNEILRDDSERLAKKMNKCGVDVKLKVFPGGWHVFQQMPIHKASNALDEIGEFILEKI